MSTETTVIATNVSCWNNKPVDLDYQTRFSKIEDNIGGSIPDDEMRQMYEEWNKMYIGNVDSSYTMTVKSEDNVIEEVRKLSPKQGDVIIFSSEREIDERYAHEVKKHLVASGIDNLILFVDSKDDISSLDEEAMEKHGWVRKREYKGREFI